MVECLPSKQKTGVRFSLPAQMKQYSWFITSTFHPTREDDVFGYNLLLISHIVNLLPITLSLLKEIPIWYSVLLILQTFISILYHCFPTKWYTRLGDWMFASILCFTTIFIFLEVNQHQLLIYKSVLLVPLFVVALGLFIQFTDYPKKHSLWHALIAIIVCIVLW